ncbi:MAG: hypothetical protein J5989_04020 [Alistipes sp.]|nr:hypothetical protein [Alistipes sp.]
MNRQAAIEEIEWYEQLVARKLRLWGKELKPSHKERLLGNMSDVLERKKLLQYKAYPDGYYAGELNDKEIPHGYGIRTYTTARRDRWVMHAGFWANGRPMGSHTLYDADCPNSRHYLAEITYRGERRKERGTIEYKLTESGIDGRRHKYRHYEGFSLSTMAVGLSFVYMLCFALIRNAKVGLFVTAIVAILYMIGNIRRKE